MNRTGLKITKRWPPFSTGRPQWFDFLLSLVLKLALEHGAGGARQHILGVGQHAVCQAGFFQIEAEDARIAQHGRDQAAGVFGREPRKALCLSPAGFENGAAAPVLRQPQLLTKYRENEAFIRNAGAHERQLLSRLAPAA